jgi:uncharacterized protein (TIGR03084 family)
MEWGEDDVRAALARQHDELASLLRDRADAEWTRASRCPGWDVTDVVLHLAQTDEMAAMSLDGGFAGRTPGLFAGDTVDDAAGNAVAAERGASAAAVFARWSAAAAGVRARLADADPHARVQWVAGMLSARTLATTRLAEAWIHTGDVAVAFDEPAAVDDRLRHIARLAWRTLPYALSRADRVLHGNVAFDLTGPNDERWAFGIDDDPKTIVRGPALDLCLVAAQRAVSDATKLDAHGPDATAVLELVRTFA